MATIKDVALDAGVSIATVSCCLSGKKNVKPETRIRILNSIQKLKYIPNSSARSLKLVNQKRIGLLFSEMDSHYHSEIIKGISSFFQSKLYHVSIAFSHNLPELECKLLDTFISENVSGLIIITCQPQNTTFFREHLLKYRIPTVFVEHHPLNLAVNYVTFNNEKTTEFLTECLLEKGYKNIALCSGPDFYSSEADCIKGHQNAYLKANHSYNTELSIKTAMTKEDSFKSAISVFDALHPDAVICTSQDIATGIQEALSVLNYEIPKDVTVITFGEESWLHTTHTSGLIESSRSAFSMGEGAASLLLDQIYSTTCFEEKTLTFDDNVIFLPLKLPKAPIHKSPTVFPTLETLRILGIDIPTSHSITLLSKNFTKRSGIKVEFTVLPHEKLFQTILKDNHSSSYYDLYMYDTPWQRYLVQNDVLANITPFVQDASFQKELIIKQLLDNCKTNNSYYGVPIIGGFQLMFYRKDLFENQDLIQQYAVHNRLPLRPPKTWTEFNSIASFFTRRYNHSSPTLYGTSIAGIIDEELTPELMPRLWAFGGSLWDNYLRARLNTPENKKAIKNFIDSLKYTVRSPFSTSISDTITDFCTGKSAMIITYSEYASQINHAFFDNPTGKVGYTMIPGHNPVTVGWNFGLNSNTKNSDSAYSYLSWLCEHNISYYITILDGQSPLKDPYENHELIKLYPWMTMLNQALSNSKNRISPHYKNALIIPQPTLESILCHVIKLIVLDKVPITDSLKQCEEELTKLFTTYGYPKPQHFI